MWDLAELRREAPEICAEQIVCALEQEVFV